MYKCQPNPHRDTSEASSDKKRSSQRKLRSRLHGNPNVEVPQDSALAQAQRAGESWGRELQEDRKRAENHSTVHYDNPTTNKGKIIEIGPNRDSGSIISETEAINAYKSIEILEYKYVKKAIEKNIHIVLSQTLKDSFELIREYEGLRERKGTLSIIEYRKLQASSKGIGSDTESYLIDLNKFLRKIEDSKTEELDIEPIKELTVTQMRKDKKEKYYENVLKKLDQLPFEGIEGISKADLQLMCLPTVDKLNKISKRIIRNVDWAPLSSPFVLRKDIRLAKSAAIYDAWIRNLEKRIDTCYLAAALNKSANQKDNPNKRGRVAWTPDHTGAENIRWSFNNSQRFWFHSYITDSSNEEALVFREDRGTLKRYQRNPKGEWDLINLGKPFGSYLQAYRPQETHYPVGHYQVDKPLPSLPSTICGRVRDIYECIKSTSAYKKAKRRPDSRRVEGEIIYDHNTGDFVRYDQERKIYDRERKMYDQARKTYEEAKRHLDHKGFTRMYGRIKWEYKSIKTSHVYEKAKRRLNPKRVEGEIVYDRNTGNFVEYDQARGSGLDGEDDPDNSGGHPETDGELSDDKTKREIASVYEKAKRRLNPKRVEGEIVYDRNIGNFVEYDQARDTYEEAKRHPDPKRAEGETVYDHNTDDLEQRTDNSSGHPETDGELSDDEFDIYNKKNILSKNKTKRGIASEMIKTRSYLSLLREIMPPDTETFKDVYDAAEWISSNENIKIKPGRHEEFLTLLRTNNQHLKEITQTLIVSDSSDVKIFMFQLAFRDAIQETKDIEGWISDINRLGPNDPLANIEQQEINIKERCRKYLQHEQVSKIISDNRKAMELAESYALNLNEAIEVYEQLIQANAPLSTVKRLFLLQSQ